MNGSIPETKILDRARALLAKAEGTDYPAEAQTYAEKAAEMMAHYGVEQAMLAGLLNADPVESREIALTDPYLMTKALLLKHAAVGLNCAMIYMQTTFRSRGKVIRVEDRRGVLWGHRSDLERVEFLYTRACCCRLSGWPRGCGPRPAPEPGCGLIGGRG